MTELDLAGVLFIISGLLYLVEKRSERRGNKPPTEWE
jgi:hypothetical protein